MKKIRPVMTSGGKQVQFPRTKYQYCWAGPWVGSRLNLFLIVILCLEYLSSGENLKSRNQLKFSCPVPSHIPWISITWLDEHWRWGCRLGRSWPRCTPGCPPPTCSTWGTSWSCLFSSEMLFNLKQWSFGHTQNEFIPAFSWAAYAAVCHAFVLAS